jgi:predicted peptidase
MGCRTYSFFLWAAFFSLIFMNSGQAMSFAGNIFKINSPSFQEEQHQGLRYRLSKPEYFAATMQTDEKYPLVVYLHGAGERGSDNRKPILGLTFLGNGFDARAKEFQKKFPSFVFVPQCPSGGSWQGEVLDNVINTIAFLQSEYPIDANRLYVIGYSMGGSGAYALAGKYYDRKGQLFAGIIRLAGQSSFDDRVHEIIAKSAVWLHIGLQDTELRVEKAREAYNRLKKIHGNGVENATTLRIKGRTGITSTLTINGREKIKITKYPDLGHGINLLPFDHPAVLEWLFAQKMT